MRVAAVLLLLVGGALAKSCCSVSTIQSSVTCTDTNGSCALETTGCGGDQLLCNYNGALYADVEDHCCTSFGGLSQTKLSSDATLVKGACCTPSDTCLDVTPAVCFADGTTNRTWQHGTCASATCSYDLSQTGTCCPLKGSITGVAESFENCTGAFQVETVAASVCPECDATADCTCPTGMTASCTNMTCGCVSTPSTALVVALGATAGGLGLGAFGYVVYLVAVTN